MKYTRRRALQLMSLGLGSSFLSGSMPALCGGQDGKQPVDAEALPLQRLRMIPSTKEEIPCVGLGTSRTFNVGATAEERAPLKEVLRLFHELGGTVLDTAPSYRNAERVSGDLMRELDIRDDMFVATKVRTRGQEEGVAEMETSLEHLHTEKLDLLQVHNLVDIETQLANIRAWKEAGKVRYVGMTTSSTRQYVDFEKWMKAEVLDFIQVDYSLGQRRAAETILPLAQDRGVAVLINRPYLRGQLFSKVGETELPEWAAEFDCASWGQFFLKYILGNPAVTAVIPATSKAKHLRDNMGAGLGALPDAKARSRIETFWDEL